MNAKALVALLGLTALGTLPALAESTAPAAVATEAARLPKSVMRCANALAALKILILKMVTASLIS